MKKTITTENIPIKLWLDEVEDSALIQAKNLANLPFAFSHVALMPDSHMGYGMPIGGILATKNVVVPNAVGVDIGCGMCAVKTSLTHIEKDTIKTIMGEIRKVIPVGFNHQKYAQDPYLMPLSNETNHVVNREYNKALTQLGTLGGGNHFIEIQKGSDDHIWVMIHSGSRNLGKQVADYYNKLAVVMNETWFSSVPKNWQLAFFPTDFKEGDSYLKEMQYCVEFALSNRKLMMERVLESMSNINSEMDCEPMINIAHNYASLEHHFGQNVYVHRKGATLASDKTIGIIPGSQGTSSYIVRGLGNRDSFMSCSHGAGRKMGRKEAKRRLDLNEEIARLDAIGVVHDVRNVSDLDEAPGAYKDITTVMDNQRDLVEILVELRPLGVIKG